MKKLFIFIYIAINSVAFCQYQEATITRTTSTNSVFARQFPSMTIRKMNNNEYWLFDSLGTNTIYHRQFPSYIVRRQNYGNDHSNQTWAVYRTTSTNSVYPVQFPDRYISALNPDNIEETNLIKPAITLSTSYNSQKQETPSTSSSYTYSNTLKSDKKPSYNPELPE